MKKYYIYALKCPMTNQIRYIGQTIKKPSYRYANHLSEARNNKTKSKKNNWINKLLKSNLLPELIIIEENINTSIYKNNREIYWIKYYIDLGHKLCNHKEGGQGLYPDNKKYKEKTVYSYNEETKEIIEYKDNKEAANLVGIHYSNIPKAIYIKGRCKGLFWNYTNDFSNFEVKKSKSLTPIIAYNNDFYKEYNSIVDCMIDLNIPKTCKSRIGYRLEDGLEYKGYYFKRLKGKNNSGRKKYKEAPTCSNTC